MPSNPPKRRPVVDVRVSDHARERARQRFPGFKAARIVDEVRAALLAGRVSPEKPSGFGGQSYEDCLYAWSDDRAYAIKALDNCFLVVTTVARKVGGSTPSAGRDTLLR